MLRKNNNLSKLLLETSLIIWDEAPTNDRRCFDTIDKTLKDITNKSDLIFGAKSVLLGCDFRQNTIKPESKKAEILA